MPACVHTQLCPTLCDPRDCSPLGSSVHGISQARMLEWVAIPFSRGSSWPSDRTQVSRAAGSFLYCRPTLYQLNQHSQGWKRGVLLNAREPEARGAASLCGRTHSGFWDTWGHQLEPGLWVWGRRDSSGLSSLQPQMERAHCFITWCYRCPVVFMFWNVWLTDCWAPTLLAAGTQHMHPCSQGGLHPVGDMQWSHHTNGVPWEVWSGLGSQGRLPEREGLCRTRSREEGRAFQVGIVYCKVPQRLPVVPRKEGAGRMVVCV